MRFWKSQTPSGDENRAYRPVGSTWFGPAQRPLKRIEGPSDTGRRDFQLGAGGDLALVETVRELDHRGVPAHAHVLHDRAHPGLDVRRLELGKGGEAGLEVRVPAVESTHVHREDPT